jgi:hypothetical protein
MRRPPGRNGYRFEAAGRRVVIVAVPRQVTTVAAGIGIPEYRTVITTYRFWCSVCRVTGGTVSHADMALDRGDRHAAAEQCHTVGQLALFALAGGAR